MRRLAIIVACAAAALLAPAPPACAINYHEVRSFSEPLGHTWEDELVHVDLDVSPEGVAADTFSVTLNEERRVPVQVEVLKGSPGDVRRVRLWFKITLPRGEEKFPVRITYNDQRKEAKQPGGTARVNRHDGRIEVSTGVAELLLKDGFRAKGGPVPLAELPPILGARPAGRDDWCGRWEAAGEAGVKRIDARIVASGPVWVEVRLRYQFAERDHAYELTIKAVDGEPWIDVIESHRLPEGSRMTATFGDRLRVREALWMPWFVWEDGKVRSKNSVVRVGLAERAGEAPFTTLRPKWTQARDDAQVCLALGRGDGEPCVGALMTSPADWHNPYEQFVRVRALPGGEGLEYVFPLGDGRRHWALLAGPADRFDSESKLQHLMRRNADIPLDRVLNEWRFEWRRNTRDPAPHILMTWERLQQIRAEFQAGQDTPNVRLIRRVLDGEVKGDRRLAEFLAGTRDDLGGRSVGGGGLYLGRAYQDDFFNPTTYPRRLKRAIQTADLSSAGRPAGDAKAALLGYIFSDLNYWPGHENGWGVGNPNFHTDMYGLALYAAAMMPDHPHARGWMRFGVKNLRDDVRRVVFLPGGAGYECPGYHSYAFGHMVEMMKTIQNSGLGDPFTWPEVRATVEFLRNIHTPPDPRLGRRTLASLGDTHAWQEGTGHLLGMVAAGMKKSDPEFAARCMALYRHYYGREGTGDLVKDVLLVEQSVEAADLADMDWKSRQYPGFGAVLRSRFGTPGETFATFKCGSARGHYQGDELSFHFYGAGMPIALDWHCGYKPRPDQEHMHNRVNLGDDENMDAVGEMLAFRSTDAADVAVGQVETGRLRKMPRYAHQIVWQASYPRRTLERQARYRRYLMLVKHPENSALQDYLVVRDELDAAEPATFNLFVLARGVERKDRILHFDGQLDADAVLYVATPEPRKVKLDRWAWPKQDESSLIPKDFRIGEDRWTRGELQQWARIAARPGEDFLAVLYPYRKGEKMPRFEALNGGRGLRVSLGDESEDVYLATDPPDGAGGQAVVKRGRDRTVVLEGGSLPPLSKQADR